MDAKEMEDYGNKNIDNGNASTAEKTEEKTEEIEDDLGFEKYETKAQKEKKKKKKKKAEEEDDKGESEADRGEETWAKFFSVDEAEQIREMMRDFRTEMKSTFKEMMKSASADRAEQGVSE